jgi:hypothetical protein
MAAFTFSPVPLSCCAASVVCLRAALAPAADAGTASIETAIARVSAAASRRIIFRFFVLLFILPILSCPAPTPRFCVGPTPLFYSSLSIAQFADRLKILFPIFTIHSLHFIFLIPARPPMGRTAKIQSYTVKNAAPEIPARQKSRNLLSI